MTVAMKKYGLTVNLNGDYSMDGQTLFAEREAVKKRLLDSLSRAHDNGIDYAEKVRAYRVLVAQTTLKLKAEGYQISIIKDLAKGDKDVAFAEYEMMVAEVKYKASNENIMAMKKFLESIEADIKREYYRE